MDSPVNLLELDRLGMVLGKDAVLKDITFSIPSKGSLVIVGPRKSMDRSILLKVLAGSFADSRSSQLTGSVLYKGAVIGRNGYPELVRSDAKLMMASVFDNVIFNLPNRASLTHSSLLNLAKELLEKAGLSSLCDKLDSTVLSLPLAIQRHLIILRHIVIDPPLLCLDDITAGLTDIEAAHIFTYLRSESENRALLLATCSQKHARLMGGDAILLVDGSIQERQPIPQIFDKPLTSVGEEFSKYGKPGHARKQVGHESAGSIFNGSQDSVKELAVDGIDSTPSVKVNPNPNPDEMGRFLWLKRGMLAGMPALGAEGSIDQDLSNLKQSGVTAFIRLTETPLDASIKPLFKNAGIKDFWEPISDKVAPTFEQGIQICKLIEQLLQQGEVIVLSSCAGLGRTGTLLVAHLIWKGISYDGAIEYVQRVEPRWVRTEEQIQFLKEFSKWV